MKESGLIDINHYATYYFANIISGILEDPFPYIRNISDYYEDNGVILLVKPFERRSAYHNFINFVVRSVIDEFMSKSDIKEIRKYVDYCEHFYTKNKISLLLIEEYFDKYGLSYTSFREWLSEIGKTIETADDDDIYDYYNEFCLTEEIEFLIDKITDGVFYVTFSDRELMQRFNLLANGFITDIALDDAFLDPEIIQCFQRDGILKRVKIPEWAKRAVFFRDKGRCVVCNKDLSGTLSIYNKENYDHIVPLAQSGLNDVSNLQLLCKECNLRKQDKNCATSTFYQKWF